MKPMERRDKLGSVERERERERERVCRPLFFHIIFKTPPPPADSSIAFLFARFGCLLKDS